MQEKRSYNLCSTYLLPLVALNRWSFGSVDNFVNCYLNADNEHLFVEVKAVTAPIKGLMAFKFEYERDGRKYAVFRLPDRFKDVPEKFREGKYSQFSDSAKTMIKKKSGLKYRVQGTDGQVRSARELLALDRDKELRKVMERELSNIGSPIIISPEAELVSTPNENNFIEVALSKTSTLQAI